MDFGNIAGNALIGSVEQSHVNYYFKLQDALGNIAGNAEFKRQERERIERRIGRFIQRKFRRDGDVQAAAKRLRKQGIPLSIALDILVH